MLKSFLFLLPITTFAQIKLPPADINAPVVHAGYSVQRSGYSIELSQLWTLDTSGAMGTDLIAYLPKEDENDNFSENLNVLVQDLSGKNIDLKEFTRISVSQVESMLGKDAILENEYYHTDAGPYHKLIYCGKLGMLQLCTIQYFFVRNDKAWVLTFSVKQEELQSYQAIAEQSMNTFRLNN